MRLRRKIHVAAPRTFLLRGIGDSMGVFDVGIRRKSVGHRIAHINALPDLFDRSFKPCNAVCEVVNGVNFALPMSGYIVFGNLASRPLSW